MTGNHWTVFNGAGAVVADNMPLDVVRTYLTPERFARDWTAAYTVIVRTPEELDAIEPPASGAFPSDAPTMAAEGTSVSNEPNEQGELS